MIKQQFRWARGSQYNTWRMSPWMAAHAPALLFFFATDILLPFLWLATAIAWLVRTIRHDGADFYAGLLHAHGRVETIVAIAVLTLTTSTLSMALRQLRHLAERPTDLLRMPLFIRCPNRRRAVTPAVGRTSRSTGIRAGCCRT
jgi:hyaluronan synthase